MIWPLLKAGKLFHPVFLQQRPRWTGGRLIPQPPSLPWVVGQFVNAARPTAARPTAVHALIQPAVFWTISGQTRDSAGAVLGNCVAQLFDTVTDAYLGEVTSNADGYYYLKTTTRSATHYVVAYKAGAPDVAGTTINTLVGT